MNPIMIGEIRKRLSTKLGRCPFCIRWSALGTVLSWSTVGLLALVRVEWITLMGAITLALGFTTLIGAHLLVFTSRALKQSGGGGWSRPTGVFVFLREAGIGSFSSVDRHPGDSEEGARSDQ